MIISLAVAARHFVARIEAGRYGLHVLRSALIPASSAKALVTSDALQLRAAKRGVVQISLPVVPIHAARSSNREEQERR
jgi:hypothetical protein